jgi:hypothetical protein
MSNVIDFLEKMGKDALLRHASQDELALALEQAQIETSLGAAIIAKSTSELYALLHQGPLFCIQTTPSKEDEEKEEGEEEGDEDDEPKAPAKKSSRKSLPSRLIGEPA